MSAALIESTFASKLPLPEPWRRKGATVEAQRTYALEQESKAESKATHSVLDGKGGQLRWLWFAEHAGKPNVVEQRQALNALLSLVEHYLSASFSAPWQGETGSGASAWFDPDRASTQGEVVVTMGAIVIVFDAVLRLVSDTPTGENSGGGALAKGLPLTQLLNGTHHQSEHKFKAALALDTHSFSGIPMRTVLEQTVITRPATLRARAKVLRYFAESSFCAPDFYDVPENSQTSAPERNVLMEKFNVLLEKNKPSLGSTTRGSSYSEYRTTFAVEGGGAAAKDAIEAMVEVLAEEYGLMSKELKPPAYLPRELQKKVPLNEGGEPGMVHSRYLLLGADWPTAPEVECLRDVLTLWKLALDWQHSIKGYVVEGSVAKQQWSSNGVLFPSDVRPGYWAQREDKSDRGGGGDGDDKEKSKVSYCFWLGRQAYTNASSSEVGSVPLRPNLMPQHGEAGIAAWLAEALKDDSTKEEEKEELKQQPKMMLQRLSATVNEDDVLLCPKLPYSISDGGSLSIEEAELLLTLLASPFVSTSLVLDFFAERTTHLLSGASHRFFGVCFALLAQPGILACQTQVRCARCCCRRCLSRAHTALTRCPAASLRSPSRRSSVSCWAPSMACFRTSCTTAQPPHSGVSATCASRCSSGLSVTCTTRTSSCCCT